MKSPRLLVRKKKLLLLIVLLLSPLVAWSQNISHEFRDVSLAEALVIIDKMSDEWQVSFIYDDLEDYRVTCTVSDKSVPEAIHALIGFYPMRIEIGEGRIFVECTQRHPYKLMGRLVDSSGSPVTYANIVLLSTADSSRITSGVSNQNGRFTIPSTEQRALVRISHVGFTTLLRQMELKDVGTLCLQTETRQLQTVDVEQQPESLPIYENNYSRYASEVRRRVWSMPLPSFQQTSAPEVLADSGAVILAKYAEFNILNQNSGWPLASMFGLLGAVGSAIAYKNNPYSSELCRVRVLLNDQKSVERWSSLAGYQSRMHLWEVGRSVVGIRIVSLDGSIREVNVDDVVAAILQRKSWVPRFQPFSIKGLQVGDILDVFYFNEEVLNELRSGFYTIDFADGEPTLDIIYRVATASTYHTDFESQHTLLSRRGYDRHGNRLYALHESFADGQPDKELRSLHVNYWRGKHAGKRKSAEEQ